MPGTPGTDASLVPGVPPTAASGSRRCCATNPKAPGQAVAEGLQADFDATGPAVAERSCMDGSCCSHGRVLPEIGHNATLAELLERRDNAGAAALQAALKAV